MPFKPATARDRFCSGNIHRTGALAAFPRMTAIAEPALRWRSARPLVYKIHEGVRKRPKSKRDVIDSGADLVRD
jgi:hypothetical protein